MSNEIINIFTSSCNIKYLLNYITKHFEDGPGKDQVLTTLTETLFDFPNYELLDANGLPRHSTSIWKEVRKLNQAFIDNRRAFMKGYKTMGIESYHNQMFIEDSLTPNGYECLNDATTNTTMSLTNALGIDNVDETQRIFRYEDKYDTNKSSIPIWQVLNKGHPDTENDSFFESYNSQIRSAKGEVHQYDIDTMPVECKKPMWYDIDN
jgi:hypothetical protein